ncbi:SdiA-regulated domain-containing protein [Amycolatopsis xylanica]|uniref:SdiA-regulated domain-containing protein n=1 Tax=Amycolatopsis xylanica TaxID=589385 RepID=UPI001FE18E53|nr:SdiA-regulated domain-containing protein [Amycolatopsis xylanica]
MSAVPSAEAATLKWPGSSSVTTADGSNTFGENMSGLSFQGQSVLWAVRNGPGTLYRLVPNGTGKWRKDTTGGWGSGKALNYADGGGDPDAEGVVSTPDGIFVSTERDGDNDSESLLKVLRYDGSSTDSSLDATAEWDLTSDLPEVGDNDGLEAISYVPDSFLTANGFYDEKTKAKYDPAKYANHGGGLYFVGLEANGTIYAYALDQNGDKFTRVATIKSGASKIMELTFEAEAGRLWAVCDNNCSGRSTTLKINGDGRFAVTATYNRPSGMSNLNNEGFAIAPQSACSAGSKPVVWADDGATGGHALRTGTLPCV